ncbi:unnamed protein product [Phyllotreta striolata]|uniref:G-protein coupled receptors family 1 profile domain-containing protein n=1 Tax=Phyllotreta striolata TaxID=444603 RepID=A0A9N9XQB2_PHYSR|nr:unnamed protein product [Phyllotreta striolata]
MLNFLFINREGALTTITNFTFANSTTLLYPNDTASLENPESFDLYPFGIVLSFTIIYAIIFVAGIIGNVGTCVVIARNKSMQTATNYYLISLAASDLLLLLSALPFEVYKMWSQDNYVFGQGFCTAQGLAAETSANATVLTITAFTAERYVAICHPFLAHAWSKPSRAVRYIICIWAIALGLAVPQAIQFGVVSELIDGRYVNHCNVENPFFEHSFEISTFVIFFVPMAVITVLYVLIGPPIAMEQPKVFVIVQTGANFTLQQQTNYTNSEAIDLYPFGIVLTFTVIYAIVFVAGLVGNISTCVVIARNKSMQNATNYYLFNLAVSDLLLLISALPFEIYKIWSEDDYVFGQGLCTAQGLAAETSANAAVLTITAFTVERYIAICHPFLAHAWSKPGRVVRYIIFIWIIALGLALPQAIQFEIIEEFIDGRYTSHCVMQKPFLEHSFELSTVFFFVVPMSVITVLYVMIGRRLRRSYSVRPTKRTSSDGGDREIGRKIRGEYVINANLKLDPMSVAVVVAFFICWAPFHAQRLLAIYLSNASEDVQNMFAGFYLYLMYISGLLYFISTSVNPCLYHIMSKKFRKAFKDTFAELCCCKKTSNGHYAAIRRIPPKMRDIPRSVSDNVASNLQKTGERPNKRNDSKVSDSSRSSFLSNSSRSTSLYDRNKSIASEHEGDKNTALLPFKFSRIFGKRHSDSAAISNSSLRDTDVTEFNHSDLVKNMIKINDNIN